MAETIYTIPVSEAFEADCECPVCELKKRFEARTIDYFAGPSLMEPDTRILTNDLGFCGRHFDMLYNSQAKKLGPEDFEYTKWAKGNFRRYIGKEICQYKLKITSTKTLNYIKTYNWTEDQKFEPQTDGSTIMTFTSNQDYPILG